MAFSDYRARGAAGREQRIPVPREARSLQGLRAGLVTRSIAAAIDVGVAAAIVVIVNAVWAFVRYVLTMTSSFTPPELALSFFTGATLLWLMWTFGWWASGRTVGSQVMGLRVIDRAGENPRLATSAIRAAFCVVLPLGLLWALISRENRSLQDVILRTSVINDWVMGLPNLSKRLQDEAVSMSRESSDSGARSTADPA